MTRVDDDSKGVAGQALLVVDTINDFSAFDNTPLRQCSPISSSSTSC
jgi:hypothetical protein